MMGKVVRLIKDRREMVDLQNIEYDLFLIYFTLKAMGKQDYNSKLVVYAPTSCRMQWH
jgi:hypothetical protein